MQEICYMCEVQIEAVLTWEEVGAMVVMSVWRIMKSVNDGVEAAC